VAHRGCLAWFGVVTGALSPEPVVSLRLDRIQYGAHTALHDVVLDVRPGEIVGVAGHVGAGKTTLALAAAGLLGGAVPARITGTVRFSARGWPPASFVFASPWTQLTELGGTVEEEVAVGPENQGLTSGIIRARVDGAMGAAGASPLATRVPRTLSGGEMQRVALASALALDAPLVVLDEPTAQLDPSSARRIAASIRALAASGRAIILVEQNLDLLAELASRVVVLADGAPLATGDPRALLERWPPLDARLGTTTAVAERNAPTYRAPLVVTDDAPGLVIEGLVAGYAGRDVLLGVDTVVPRGAVCAWLGENGAGKTTLARAVVGLVPTHAGTMRVAGAVLDGLPVELRARLVGLVFQDPSRQLFARRVIDEAAFGPRALGESRTGALAMAREALAIVGLEGLHQVNPGDLVPQLQRRLAIAAAMAARPPLLILDEPTAGQDAEGRAWIVRALEQQRSRGAGVVITHDLTFAGRVCDFAVTIARGRVSLSRSDVPFGAAD
jgi:energy-coupling factor transport system ATP-binding protein